MFFDTLLFDLDDTLYSPDSGIWEAIGNRMVDYMITRLGIPQASAPAERERLFHTHGTTMRGLVAEYQIDEVDFLEYVHDIPINQYLSKNVVLRSVLESYPQRKIIFTNADTGHASRVLDALGIRDLFEQIIDIRSIKPWCKPQAEAFARAIELANIKNPKNCVMIDDALRNLITAHDFGLFTIQVGAQEIIEPVDAVVLTVEELPKILVLDDSIL
jgi:putative hydrolase of the HAD superfamily